MHILTPVTFAKRIKMVVFRMYNFENKSYDKAAKII